MIYTFPRPYICVKCRAIEKGKLSKVGCVNGGRHNWKMKREKLIVKLLRQIKHLILE